MRGTIIKLVERDLAPVRWEINPWPLAIILSLGLWALIFLVVKAALS